MHTASELSGKVRDELRRVPILQAAALEAGVKLQDAGDRENDLVVQVKQLQPQLFAHQREAEARQLHSESEQDMEIRRLQMEVSHWQEQYHSMTNASASGGDGGGCGVGKGWW